MMMSDERVGREGGRVLLFALILINKRRHKKVLGLGWFSGLT